MSAGQGGGQRRAKGAGLLLGGGQDCFPGHRGQNPQENGIGAHTAKDPQSVRRTACTRFHPPDREFGLTAEALVGGPDEVGSVVGESQVPQRREKSPATKEA